MTDYQYLEQKDYHKASKIADEASKKNKELFKSAKINRASFSNNYNVSQDISNGTIELSEWDRNESHEIAEFFILLNLTDKAYEEAERIASVNKNKKNVLLKIANKYLDEDCLIKALKAAYSARNDGGIDYNLLTKIVNRSLQLNNLNKILENAEKILGLGSAFGDNNYIIEFIIKLVLENNDARTYFNDINFKNLSYTIEIKECIHNQINHCLEEDLISKAIKFTKILSDINDINYPDYSKLLIKVIDRALDNYLLDDVKNLCNDIQDLPKRAQYQMRLAKAYLSASRFKDADDVAKNLKGLEWVKYQCLALLQRIWNFILSLLSCCLS
ncbi:MAG: hypothetical protein WDZ28_01570 [Simkaniaceae bacterium]